MTLLPRRRPNPAPGVRTRWVRHFNSSALDRALAQGACPEGDSALRLHASRLTDSATRNALAATLRRLVRPHPALGHRVAADRRAVNAARSDLDRLAARLESASDVRARGVARVRLLLTSGDGPLYSRHSQEDLPALVRAALDDL